MLHVADVSASTNARTSVLTLIRSARLGSRPMAETRFIWPTRSSVNVGFALRSKFSSSRKRFEGAAIFEQVGFVDDDHGVPIDGGVLAEEEFQAADALFDGVPRRIGRRRAEFLGQVDQQVAARHLREHQSDEGREAGVELFFEQADEQSSCRCRRARRAGRRCARSRSRSAASSARLLAIRRGRTPCDRRSVQTAATRDASSQDTLLTDARIRQGRTIDASATLAVRFSITPSSSQSVSSSSSPAMVSVVRLGVLRVGDGDRGVDPHVANQVADRDERPRGQDRAEVDEHEVVGIAEDAGGDRGLQAGGQLRAVRFAADLIAGIERQEIDAVVFGADHGFGDRQAVLEHVLPGSGRLGAEDAGEPRCAEVAVDEDESMSCGRRAPRRGRAAWSWHRRRRGAS